jgi:hypothetical protein
MKCFAITIGLTVSAGALAAPHLPIHSGQFTFQHKMAEQPNIPGTSVRVKITGHHIVVISDTPFDVFGKGTIDEGTLMWHAKSKQWIIGESQRDRFAPEVGGCSTGPAVVDLRKKIYWSC